MLSHRSAHICGFLSSIWHALYSFMLLKVTMRRETQKSRVMCGWTCAELGYSCTESGVRDAETQQRSSLTATCLSFTPPPPRSAQLASFNSFNVSFNVKMSSIAEFFQQPDRTSRFNFLNEAFRARSSSAPADRERMAKLEQDFYYLLNTPSDSLSPDMQELQQSARNDSAVRFDANGVPHMPSQADFELYERRIHLAHIADVLEPFPTLKHLQDKVHKLLVSNGETVVFSLPALLNSITKHLGRRQAFLVIVLRSSPDEAMIACLESLYNRKPFVHKALLGLLVQATLVDQPPHPKRCTCLLCAHFARVTGSTGSST